MSLERRSRLSFRRSECSGSAEPTRIRLRGRATPTATPGEQREREPRARRADHERRERRAPAGDLGARGRDDQMATAVERRTRRARTSGRAAAGRRALVLQHQRHLAAALRRATSAGWLSGSIVRPPGSTTTTRPWTGAGGRVLEQRATARAKRVTGDDVSVARTSGTGSSPASTRSRRGHGVRDARRVRVAHVDHGRNGSRLRGRRQVEGPGVPRAGRAARRPAPPCSLRPGRRPRASTSETGRVAAVARVDAAARLGRRRSRSRRRRRARAPARAVAAHATRAASATPPETPGAATRSRSPGAAPRA